MNPELILWPIVIMALVTLFVYIPMSRSRVAAVKSGKAKARDFKLIQNEPEESLQFSNVLRNQYETPILFYAVCLAAYVSENTGSFLIVLAWVYAISKTIHVYVHATSNNLRIRRPMFMVAYGVLIVMWVVFALSLLGIF